MAKKGELKSPLFILAPMDDVTDTVFRQIVSSCAAPDYCFSEFVNVEGLLSPGRSRLLPKLDWNSIEPPLIAHIWGINPDHFRVMADDIASGKIAKELGLKQNYAGIDLNMGCPARTVVKSGACSALIKNHELAAEIIKATKKGAGGRLPVSVKTRLGYERIEPEWTQFLLKQDVSMLTIHLRTVKEMSKVPAHFNELKRIKEERDSLAPNTLLVANGDILSREHGQELIDCYGLDGVMIGRGVFHDPFVFSDSSPWEGMEASDRLNLFKNHLRLYMQWAINPDKGVARLNKYAKIYICGFDGAKELRDKLASRKSIQQMLDEVESFSEEYSYI